MGTIKPDDFYQLIVDSIAKYDKDVQNAVQEEVEATVKPIRTDLRNYSYPGHLMTEGKGRGGKHYKAGWKIAKFTKGNVYRRRVYNSTKAPLAHLLELGHGGIIQAKDYPHISPTELKYAEILYKRLKERIDKL